MGMIKYFEVRENWILNKNLLIAILLHLAKS